MSCPLKRGFRDWDCSCYVMLAVWSAEWVLGKFSGGGDVLLSLRLFLSAVGSVWGAVFLSLFFLPGTMSWTWLVGIGGEELDLDLAGGWVFGEERGFFFPSARWER